MAHKPVGSGSSFSISGTSAQSDIISKQSDTLRVVSVNSDCFVAIGTNPVSTNSNYYVRTNSSETISIGQVKSQKVVGVTTGATTIIDFPSGTESSFEVGDSVQLTGISPAGINTNFAIVSSINASSGYDGYYSTRLVLNWDTSSQSTPTDSIGELREVFKVSGKSSGASGALYIQQVQIKGVT
jgi:hypothetical protein